jgi:hypothetical protein
MFSRTELPADARWVYDDPSGVPEAPLTLEVPASLRPGVERAAAGAGLTPTAWLVAHLSTDLCPATSKAA